MSTSDHLTVVWKLRDGQTCWQPRAIDGTVLNRHWRRKVAIATGYSGVSVWESPGPNAHLGKNDPDVCRPIVYRWRWQARLKARRRNRHLAKQPASYQLDGIWHENTTP